MIHITEFGKNIVCDSCHKSAPIKDEKILPTDWIMENKETSFPIHHPKFATPWNSLTIYTEYHYCMICGLLK